MQLSFPDGTIIQNPEGIVAAYFKDMYLGRRYEEWVYSCSNREMPNRLLMQNWNAAFWVRARSMKWVLLERFFSDSADGPLPLNTVPRDAELENDWPRPRELVSNLLTPLLRIRGIRAANATKLLYQKRSSLIPILDSRVCERLHGDWDLKNVGDVLSAVDVFYAAITETENRSVLSYLKKWIGSATEFELSGEARAGVSMLRIYDLVAWHRDPN
jgi:hypothetical protein